MKNLKFEKIKTEEFSIIYKDMESQFPKSELKDYCVLENLLNTGVLQCIGAYDGNILVGYVLYVPLCESIKWIDYVAVKKEFQSKGYGTSIMKSLKNCYLEVEKPNISLPNTIRRIDFYKSLGARKIDINYVYPNDFGGLPMDLYYIGENFPDNQRVIETICEVFNELHFDVKIMPQILQSIKLS